jgi:hypothetical protein
MTTSSVGKTKWNLSLQISGNNAANKQYITLTPHVWDRVAAATRASI